MICLQVVCFISYKFKNLLLLEKLKRNLTLILKIMNLQKQDPEEILKKLFDEINNFNRFFETWKNTVDFLRDETDYVNKASRLSKLVYTFTKESCCVIFYLNNIVLIYL